MSVRSERFYGRMESLDVLDAALCEKARVLSDRGAGVRRLLDTLDARPGAVHDAERERDAVNGAMVLLWAIVLTAGGCGYLVPTLRLICQNGCDSAASVEAIRAAGTARDQQRAASTSCIVTFCLRCSF